MFFVLLALAIPRAIADGPAQSTAPASVTTTTTLEISFDFVCKEDGGCIWDENSDFGWSYYTKSRFELHACQDACMYFDRCSGIEWSQQGGINYCAFWHNKNWDYPSTEIHYQEPGCHTQTFSGWTCEKMCDSRENENCTEWRPGTALSAASLHSSASVPWLIVLLGLVLQACPGLQ